MSRPLLVTHSHIGQIRKRDECVAEREQGVFRRYARWVHGLCCVTRVLIGGEAMTAAQTRLAETIDTFYAAADKASEGAMAGHAYKRSVDELDAGVTRELASPQSALALEMAHLLVGRMRRIGRLCLNLWARCVPTFRLLMKVLPSGIKRLVWVWV